MQEFLDAYFARIGYTGPRAPTLDVLRAIQALHPAAIPFEALDVLLHRPVSLAPADIDAKLVYGGRGGYCFEQNNLYMRVLQALGFEVEGLIAQVQWQLGAEGLARPRTHMVLRVTVDGVRWLADVGFGSAVLTAPLRFDSDVPQTTPHERFRVTQRGNEHLLEVEFDGLWQPVYQVSPALQTAGDYEMANYYTATYPSSHFRHKLIVARTTPLARKALLQNRLTIRHPDGSMERSFLDADAIERALRETFQLPVHPGWRLAIQAAAATVWEGSPAR